MQKIEWKHLAKYKTDLHRCIRCGYCIDQVRFRDNVNEVCPFRVTEAHTFESYEARGKLEIASAAIDGSLPTDEETGKRLAEIFYLCSTCRNCWEKCYVKNDINTVEIYEAVRADLFSAGFTLPRQKAFVEWTSKEHNPYMESHNTRLNWVPNGFSHPEKADVLYFVGCTSSYRQTNIAQATASILKKLGINFTILGLEERCCGSPSLRVGAPDIATELAEHNVEAIKKTEAKLVVFSCAGCYRTFRIDYPQLVGELDFDLQHVTQYLSQQINEGNVKADKELNTKVTYHDPCHMVRHLAHLGKNEPVIKQPREILNSIPGIELVEMPRTKLNAFCCGSGGGARSGFPDESLELAAHRVREAEETGSEYLVSSCPFCYRSLMDAMKNINSKLTMYDITELLDQVL